MKQIIEVWHARARQPEMGISACTLLWQPTVQQLASVAAQVARCEHPDLTYYGVALVHAEGDTTDALLERAFERTNNIDCAWIENKDVTPMESLRTHGGRSTSVGDMLVMENGDHYVVAPMGFHKFNLTDRT